jgi:hypothetical protein
VVHNQKRWPSKCINMSAIADIPFFPTPSLWTLLLQFFQVLLQQIMSHNITTILTLYLCDVCVTQSPTNDVHREKCRGPTLANAQFRIKWTGKRCLIFELMMLVF